MVLFTFHFPQGHKVGEEVWIYKLALLNDLGSGLSSGIFKMLHSEFIPPGQGVSVF